MKEGVRALSQALMEMEVEEHIGAARHERTPGRKGQRNGYRQRIWDTRVGAVELSVPRVRDGSYFPSLLEPRRRAERALSAVVQEAYVHGVSTRKVDEPQNDKILNGKILRINRNGTIPSDNPLYGGTTLADDAIWALGVRQPYNLDVLSGTSPRMFLNDVGEDSWEEIDEVALDAASSPANYGWPNYEGYVSSPDPSLQNYQNPVFSYAHSGDPDSRGCAITGGAFYDPATVQFPSMCQGDYFYADFCGGWIRSFDPATGVSEPFASGLVKPVDLEVGDNGSLYYLSWHATSVPFYVHEIKYKQETTLESVISSDSNKWGPHV